MICCNNFTIMQITNMEFALQMEAMERQQLCLMHEMNMTDQNLWKTSKKPFSRFNLEICIIFGRLGTDCLSSNYCR